MLQAEIIEFLLKAKKATYAGKGLEEKPLRPEFYDLKFERRAVSYTSILI